MKIVTKRLILRDITMKDAKDLVENINNLKVSRYLLTVPYPYTIKDAKWWINHCKEKAKEKPRKSYDFNIELKSEKKIIGGIGLTKVDLNQGTAELGYWLGTNYHRKGFMTESVNRVIDFAFNELKLRRLETPIFKENKPSQELAKSLGFKYEGTKRKSVKTKSTGKIHDVNVYSLLKEEWSKVKRKIK